MVPNPRQLTQGIARMGGAAVVSIGLLTTALSSPSAANTTSDTTPPTLQAFSVSPTSVDASTGPQTVTGTATITDDLSGVSDTTDSCPPACAGTTQVEFQSPSGIQTVFALFAHTTGDEYTTDITIPQYAENGVWTVRQFFLIDNAGNENVLSGSDLSAIGIDVTITVGAVPSFTLTVSKSGTGEGIVTSSPSGIDCGSICSALFDKDTLVKLTATPLSGSRFLRWSGDCKGRKICTVEMTSSKNVGTVFKLSKRQGNPSR